MADVYVCPPPESGLISGSAGQLFAIIVSAAYPVLILASLLFFRYFQSSSVYLRKRSFGVVCFSACGALVAWSVTSLYDAVGPDKYPCALFGLLTLGLFLMVNLPPLFALTRYRNEMAAIKLAQKRYGQLVDPKATDADTLSLPTMSQAFAGHLRLTFGSREKQDKLLHAKFARSIYFPLFYGGINALPYLIYYFVKVGTDPRYYQGCYGCEIDETDSAFLLSMSIFGSGMGVCLNSSRVTKHDALRIVRECVFVWLASGVLITITFILILVDPGNLYSMHLFNWKILLIFSVCATIYIQTIHQVIMSQLLQRQLLLSGYINQVERFKDVMNNKGLKQDLRNHLNSELSGEILPFLESVENFKANFDRDGSEHRSNDIFDTFIVRFAPLEINLSSATRDKLLDHRDLVSPEMFDKAYDEIKVNLLNDGFARYLQELKKPRQDRASLAVTSEVTTTNATYDV